MKVIKDNYTPWLNNHNIVCDKCESILQYNENDICIDFFDGTDFVVCPLCNHEIVINNESDEYE